MLCAAILTPWGGNIIGFLVAYCHPAWNERAVERLLQSNAPRARRMMLALGILPRRRQQQEEKSEQKHPLMIKTGVYRTPSKADRCTKEDSDNEDSEVSESHEDCSESVTSSGSSSLGEECTICMAELAEGDRVGILSCQHTFRK